MTILNSVTWRIIAQRLLFSLGILLFIRVGSFLPVPVVNHTDLAIYIQTHPLTRSFVSTFSGEETFIIGLFTLNIFPYINASILVQLLTAFSPALSQLRKEGDLKSRRSLNQLTRIVTLILAIIQSIGIGLYLRQVLFNWNLGLFLQVILWLTTGTIIVLWLSELITDFGLGNGASLLIYTNIISSFPNLLKTILIEISQNVNILSIILASGLIIISLIGILLLQDSVREIPLISSKQLNRRAPNSYSKIDIYLPLKLNQAGVMPIILTTAILVLPGYLSNLSILPSINFINLGIFSKIFYWIGYFVLIVGFSLFYANIILSPKDISEQLQKASVAIPGIRPGIQTAFYLKKVMQRLTLIGALTLGVLATFPNLIEAILNTSSLNGLSTTSLLIITGVLADIWREIEDVVYSNVYKKNNFKF